MQNDFDTENDLEKIDERTNQSSLSTSEDEIIACPKCGGPMKRSSRCCMHCGELNVLNKANDHLKPVFDLGKKLKAKEEKRNAKKLLRTANFVDANGVSKREKRFKLQKRIVALIVIVLIIIAGINYKKIIPFITTFRSQHYINQVDRIMVDIDNKIKNNQCTKIEGVSGSEMIFAFPVSEDYFKTSISFYTFDYFTGYVRIVPDSDSYKYYLTISDGKYGFKDVLYQDKLDPSIVVRFDDSFERPTSTMTCN